MTAYLRYRILAVLAGVAGLVLVVPAQAEWGGGYGGTPGASGKPSGQGRPGNWNQSGGYGGSQGRPGGWNQGGQGHPGGWNQNAGDLGYGGRPCRGSYCGHRPGNGGVYRPVDYGGRGYDGYGGPVRGRRCINYGGQPYIYHGPGRCPIS